MESDRPCFQAGKRGENISKIGPRIRKLCYVCLNSRSVLYGHHIHRYDMKAFGAFGILLSLSLQNRQAYHVRFNLNMESDVLYCHWCV